MASAKRQAAPEPVENAGPGREAVDETPGPTRVVERHVIEQALTRPRAREKPTPKLVRDGRRLDSELRKRRKKGKSGGHGAPFPDTGLFPDTGVFPT